MEVYEAIKSRRSIRKYKASPIDDKSIELILEAARWAPSSNNTQCWRFVVVRDAKIRGEIADAIPSTNPSADAVRKAPVIIVACVKLGEADCIEGELDWSMFDIALAMHNLVLAAHSIGLGTVYIGVFFNSKKISNILGLPPDLRVVSMTPLGYPDHQPHPPLRKELSKIVYYDKYSSE
jgi:nitroreductase